MIYYLWRRSCASITGSEVHGIQLVVLFTRCRDVNFPVAYRVKEKNTPPPTTLAREVIPTIPAFIRSRSRVQILTGGGFEPAALLEEAQQLGFEVVVGVRMKR